MPTIVNPSIKHKLKQGLKKGKDCKTACLEAGLAPATAHNATSHKVVKDCLEEIGKELSLKDITPEMMIKRFNEDRELAIAKGDYATATRVDELLSKAIAMIDRRNERPEDNTDKDLIHNYINSNRLSLVNKG